MNLDELVEKLPLTCLTPYSNVKVTGAYTSDLMSDVIANAKENQLWVTLQGHQNVVAVSLLKELAGVIISGGYMPDSETLARAKKEKLAIFSTKLSNFEISGLLYDLLKQNNDC